ncbi:copper amine oxidase N-terminal domain-containing protein [Cohnella abietis]|uniref:Copper amine oxidase-like N-terminal domain-containing protein n=1 Tax=Cohnella abietis TaxID=2507935 RepID=A0A3T1CZN4_9BACL|nr:copper amine oxidase N-terminal domain-containing protein [Cohnella abietis]BBI31229.1 hypothetical protein KCTCHS21_06280 [Cohnella abietis]
MMKNKKIALSGLIVATAASLFSAPPSHAAEVINSVQFKWGQPSYTNSTGKHLLAVAPYELHGHSMVPLRALTESLGTSINWNKASQTATLSGKSFGQIKLSVNTNIAINAKGEKIKLPEQVKVVKGSLFVPARSIAALIGAKANWTSSTRTITITKIADVNAIKLSYQFDKNNEGWKGGFSDLPVDYNQDIYELKHARELLPVGDANKTNYGLKLQGHNRSDDLFMFLSRNVGGFVPNATYQVKLNFAIYTDVADGMMGIGGSPGNSVIVKAGILNKEPLSVETAGAGEKYYRMNIDKGNQTTGGTDVKVLGNIAKPDSEKQGYQRKDFEYNATVKTNAKGELFLLVGVDSGYEGLTTLYFDDINVTATQK